MTTYKVTICNTDVDGRKTKKNSSEVELPFPPFFGLHIRVPHLGGDFQSIKEIYWLDENTFEVFL